MSFANVNTTIERRKPPIACFVSAPLKRLNQWLVICLMAALPGLAHAATQKPDADYQRADHKVDDTYGDGTFLEYYLAAAESFEQVAQAGYIVVDDDPYIILRPLERH